MEIGIAVEGFLCDIYIPRKPFSREWLCDVCHTLWCHGLQFLVPNMATSSWDEQLHIVYPSNYHVSKSLSDQIDTIVEGGDDILVCYDHEVEFLLHIDANLSNLISMGFDLDFSAEEQAVLERSLWGKIQLHVRRPVIEIDQRLAALPPAQAPSSIYLIPPYQHIHLAMLHWTEILCQKLQSAFAVGYYNTNSYFAEEDEFNHKFDVAMLTALEQQQMPPLRDWLSSIYILYTSAHLKEVPYTEAWLSSLMLWKRQLADGSSLAYTMPETQDDLRVKEYNAAAETILKQKDYERFPLARIYLQRAREVSTIAQRKDYSYTTNRLLEQLEYMEERRKQQ